MTHPPFESMQFRHVARVEEPDGDVEDFIDTPRTFSLVCRQYVQVIPLTGEELVEARKIHPRVTHRVRTRWFDRWTTSLMRFVMNGREFWSAAAKTLEEKNRVLEFLCTEETESSCP